MNISPQDQQMLGQMLSNRIQTGMSSSPYPPGRAYATHLAQNQAAATTVFSTAATLLPYYRATQSGVDHLGAAVEDAYQYHFAVMAQSTPGWMDQIPNGYQQVQESLIRMGQKLQAATSFAQTPQPQPVMAQPYPPQVMYQTPQPVQGFGVPGMAMQPTQFFQQGYAQAQVGHSNVQQYVSSRTDLNADPIPRPQPAPQQPMPAPVAQPQPNVPPPVEVAAPALPAIYLFLGNDNGVPPNIIPYVTRTSQPNRQLLISYDPITKTAQSRVGDYTEAGNAMDYEAHKTHRLFAQVSPTDRISDPQAFTTVLSMGQQLAKVAYLEDKLRDESRQAATNHALANLSSQKTEVLPGLHLVPDAPYWHQSLKLVLSELGKNINPEDTTVVVELGLFNGWTQEDPKLQTILKDLDNINSWNGLCQSVVEQTRSMPPYIWAAMNNHITNAFNDVIQLGLKRYTASLGNFAMDGRTAVEDITNGLANQPEALEWFMTNWAYTWNSACIPHELADDADQPTGMTILRTVQCTFMPLMNGTIDLCYPGPVGYVPENANDMLWSFLNALHNINPTPMRRLLISKQGSIVKFMKCYDGGFSLATVD